MKLSFTSTTNTPRCFLHRGLLMAALLVAAFFPGLAGAQSTSLNMVAVGINRYRQPGMDLQFAVNDAKEVAASLRGNRLFARADVNLLTDSQATVKNIMDAVALLERRAHTKSYSVLFLSGHGTRDGDGHFLYPTYDYDPSRADATSISGDALQTRLRRMPGRVILVIDACHSGSAGLIRKDWVPPAKSNETIIISSSLARELSLELGTVSNGAFTQAFLEAMSGAADKDRNGAVSVNEMHSYVYARVVKLTDGKQHIITHVPTLAHGNLSLSLVPPPAPTTAVAWQGNETLKGYGPLKFDFHNGGRVVMTDAKSQMIGTWSASGEVVTLRFASGRINYTGRMSGSTFSGTAANHETRWTFAVARR